MTIFKMHYLIKEEANKLNSNHLRDLNTLQIDETINEVQNILQQSLLKDDARAEVSQQKSEILAPFLIKYPKQPFIPLTKVGTIGNHDVYTAKKSDLIADFVHELRLYSETDCGIINVGLYQHEDLNYILEFDNQLKPSKKWKRLVGTLNDEGFTIYAEKGHKVKNLYIEYYRKPKDVFFGGYDSLEYSMCRKKQGNVDCSQYYSKNDDPVDSEYPDKFHRLLVNMAVKEIYRKLQFGGGIQLEQEKINNIIN